MTNTVTGSVINKVKFEIDSKSWQNLNKFQKRIADVKKQLAGLSGNIKVNAVVGQINKVTKAVEASSKRMKKATSIDLPHLFPSGKIGMSATNTIWAQEAKQMDKWHSEALRMDARFEKDKLKRREAIQKRWDKRKSDRVLKEQRIQLQIEKAHGRAIEMNKRFDARRSRGTGRSAAGNVLDIREQSLARITPAGGASRLSDVRRDTFNQQFQSLASQYVSGTTSLKVFRSQVNALTADLLRQERQARSTAIGLGDICSGIIQMTAAYTGFSVAANVFNTGKEFDSLTASMKLFAKDDAGVKAEMKFISDEAERLGINFQEAATQYTKFAIVARNKISPEQTKEIFTGLSEYATVLQVDQYRFQRAMLSLNQMMSKGTVMSEELKGQLAENLPGAVGIFASAMGVTEKELFKLMEQSRVISDEVLPKVGKEMARVARENGALDAAVTKVNSQYQRFLSSITRLKVEMFEGGFGQAMGQTFGKLSEFINENKSSLIAFGGVAVGVFQALATAVWALAQPLAFVGSLFTAAFGVDGAKFVGWAVGGMAVVYMLAKMRSALMMIQIPLMLTAAKVLAISGAVIAVAEGIAYLTTGRTISSRIAETYSGGAANQIAMQASGRVNSSQTVNVVVEPNERGFRNLITAEVKTSEKNFSGQLEQAVATV